MGELLAFNLGILKTSVRVALLISASLAMSMAQARTGMAAELKEAQAALAAGDFDTAYPQYLAFAEKKDNALAQFTVGMFHRLGWGSRAVDPAVACGWFEKAAAGHIPLAVHYFAECLEQGIGRPADPAQAAIWYERAAGLGHHMSLCSLADLYMEGRGVDKDPQKGLALCRQAAEKGATPAWLRVGRYLLEGETAIRDPKAAHAVFEALAGDSPEAQYYLGIMHRDGLGQPPSAGEARLWFERAASQGYVPAYFQTARLYFEVSPDYQSQPPPADDLAKAYMWLSATAHRSEDPQEREQTRAMLEQVRRIMPETWAPTLDERVATHLAEHPALH